VKVRDFGETFVIQSRAVATEDEALSAARLRE
jgi:hypothetical protein